VLRRHPVEDNDAQMGPEAVSEIDGEDGHALTLRRAEAEDHGGLEQIVVEFDAIETGGRNGTAWLTARRWTPARGRFLSEVGHGRGGRVAFQPGIEDLWRGERGCGILMEASRGQGDLCLTGHAPE